MTFLKLTELNLTIQDHVVEKTIYVNAHHIKKFYETYSVNHKMDLTRIYWALGGFNATLVKETPEQILNLLNK
jgi:hypothetical protein